MRLTQGGGGRGWGSMNGEVCRRRLRQAPPCSLPWLAVWARACCRCGCIRGCAPHPPASSKPLNHPVCSLRQVLVFGSEHKRPTQRLGRLVVKRVERLGGRITGAGGGPNMFGAAQGGGRWRSGGGLVATAPQSLVLPKKKEVCLQRVVAGHAPRKRLLPATPSPSSPLPAHPRCLRRSCLLQNGGGWSSSATTSRSACGACRSSTPTACRLRG
jgi:hypothetical protein